MKLDSSNPHRAMQMCVVCGGPAELVGLLCSQNCLSAARDELDTNKIVLQSAATPSSVRASLAARNGHLISAVSRCPSDVS